MDTLSNKNKYIGTLVGIVVSFILIIIVYIFKPTFLFISFFIITCIGIAISIYIRRKEIDIAEIMFLSVIISSLNAALSSLFLEILIFGQLNLLVINSFFSMFIIGGATGAIFGFMFYNILTNRAFRYDEKYVSPQTTSTQYDYTLRLSKFDPEKIIGEVYGVAGTPYGLSNIKEHRRWPNIGGEYISSNALFFTNKRLFFMFIEATILNGLIPLNLDKTKQKGKEMIQNLSPDEVLKSNNYNIALSFDEIKEIRFKKWKEYGSAGDSFLIKTINNREYKYVFLNRTDIKTLERILSNVLISKATIESGKLIR